MRKVLESKRMNKALRTMSILLFMGVITMGMVSCDTAYHRKTDKMIVECEKSLKQNEIAKCVSGILEVKVTRELTQEQKEKLKQIEDQVNDISKAAQKKAKQEQEEKEREKRLAKEKIEREKRQAEEQKRDTELKQAAYSEIMQLQDDIRSLLYKADQYRTRINTETYGSFHYQSARIEYGKAMGAAIEKQKRAIKIAKNKIQDETLVIELGDQLELLENEKRSEDAEYNRRGREFSRRGY